MAKTKFWSLDAIVQPEDQENANAKSVLLVDYSMPLLEAGNIESQPRKLGKRLRGWAVRKRKQEIADLMSAISNSQALLAINVEREKNIYKQVIEQVNTELPKRELGKVYFSLSFRDASRKDKIRLLRAVWAKQAWRLQKTKRQTSFEFASWLTQRNKLASKKRNC